MPVNQCKILVCCHKPTDDSFGGEFLPIHCGASLHHKIPGMQTDDFPGGISSKNASYCELTGLFWAWKNLLSTDTVGLCHYRRFFDFHNQARLPYQIFPSIEIKHKDLSVPKDVIERVKEGAIVVPSPVYLPTSVAMNFCFHHNSNDFRVLEEEVSKRGRLYDEFQYVMHKSVRLYCYNMFIMNKSELNKMSEFLFPILESVDSRVDCTSYDTYQKRFIGFIGERLMNVWFYYRRKRLIEIPVMCFSDAEQYGGMSPVIYKLQHLRSLLGRMILGVVQK